MNEVKEKNVLLTGTDVFENRILYYPITKLDCVDGADELARRDEIAQADWDCADENSAAFIHNKPFGVMPDVYPLQKYTSTNEPGGDFLDMGNKFRLVDFKQSKKITEGEEYVVVWDGVEYICRARRVTYNVTSNISTVGNQTSPLLCLGNPRLYLNIKFKFFTASYYYIPTSIADGDITDEPFLITAASTDSYFDRSFTDTDGEHTLRVYQKDNVKKIDPTYLPDDVLGNGSEHMQADWNEDDEDSPAYIKNKPNLQELRDCLTDYYKKSEIDAKIPGSVSQLVNDMSYVTTDDLNKVYNNMLDANILIPIAKWNGDIASQTPFLGMFCKVSEHTEPLENPVFKLSLRAIENENAIVDIAEHQKPDVIMTAFQDMLGLTIYYCENIPIVVVAGRSGELPSSLVAELTGVNPGMDIPYEAGTYAWFMNSDEEGLREFVSEISESLSAKVYIDRKFEELKKLISDKI